MHARQQQRQPAYPVPQHSAVGRPHGRPLRRRRQRAARDLATERAVAFKLVFIEPLVGRGLVGKLGMSLAVVEHVRVFPARDGRLDIQQHAILAPPVGGPVLDVARDEAGAQPAAAHRRHDAARVEHDGHMQVRVALADGIAQVFEHELFIAAGVHGHHQPAAPAHQFVQAQVLEMAAVGQVEEVGIGVRQPEQLGQNAEQTDAGRRTLPVLFLDGVGRPASQPQVKQRHEEGQRRR